MRMHPSLIQGDVGSRSGCSHSAGNGSVALPPRHRHACAELSVQVDVIQAGQGCPWVLSGSKSGWEAKGFSERKGRGEVDVFMQKEWKSIYLKYVMFVHN